MATCMAFNKLLLLSILSFILYAVQRWLVVLRQGNQGENCPLQVLTNKRGQEVY